MPVRHWNASKEVGDLTIAIGRAKYVPERVDILLKWLASRVDEVDPGYGVGEGGSPDQGLPSAPVTPDQGLPGSGGRPSKPVDPNYGVDQGGMPPAAGTKPVEPDEGAPDNTLPGGGASAGQLPAKELSGFIKHYAKELVKAIVKDTACDEGAQPKR